MSYLVDGHNLIPKVPGLSLSDPDDELHLIRLLQDYCRREGKKGVEVFFDKAPPGQPVRQAYGAVTAHFVRAGKSADDAIRLRLKQLGREARNWTVVSSDREVLAAAREAGAHRLTSEMFADLLVESRKGHPEDAKERDDVSLNDQEVEYWLKWFGKNKSGGKRPSS